MIKQLRQLAIAGLLLPVCLPLAAATNGLSNKVQQSLKANKISSQSLSVVTVPLNGPGSSTYFNADISVNPASTMKLVTTYAALELLGMPALTLPFVLVVWCFVAAAALFPRLRTHTAS